jgi:ribosomal protein S12 methylthiotransferase
MRLKRFMETQSKISHKKLANKVGQICAVLVDGHEADYAIARSMADAPDIDGKVYLRDGKLLKPGDFVDVKIESYDQHDLFAGPNV